jgi:hypothetical protein
MTQRLDGNSLAGPLSMIFCLDPTVAVASCNNCGEARPLASSIVYSSTMGHVVRCAVCDNTLMTVVQGPVGTFLNSRGLTWLRIDPGTASGRLS